LERIQFNIATTDSWAGWKHKERQRFGCRSTQRTEGKRERKKKMGRQCPEPAPDTQF
jgi:hypothetical protein